MRAVLAWHERCEDSGQALALLRCRLVICFHSYSHESENAPGANNLQSAGRQDVLAVFNLLLSEGGSGGGGRTMNQGFLIFIIFSRVRC